MAFDKTTRNAPQKFVDRARRLLSEEFTRQLQATYGMDPKTGTVAELAALDHLDNQHFQTAEILRETLHHYLAVTQAKSEQLRTRQALERMVREQAFTVLNRLAALRMAEARGVLLESLAQGQASQGFQLYQMVAGPALGEVGDAYRHYLFSLCDEFSQDLAVLFDRHSPQGLLFPKDSVLLDLLDSLNHPDIAHLWAEDETIGWIYQYYNDPDERKQMRAESAAPRDSRELAVRNQFFTPRYVVEFLTDNTLGRIWHEMTQGQTRLVDQCRYLVRRPREIFLAPGATPPRMPDQEGPSQEELLQQPVYIPHRPLEDPRDIRLLDPACGSMHFGLYAFDLFETIYEEAWDNQLSVVGGQWSEDSDEQAAILSRIAGLAEVDGSGGSRLPLNQGLSERGNVRVDQPDSTLGSLDPLEHRRGPGAELDTAVSSSSVHRLRLIDGNGNPNSDCLSPGLSHARPSACSHASDLRNRADVEWLIRRACKKANWSLTTEHRPLLLDYPSKDDLIKDIPRLIIEHNLHGIDIDPRAAQIASLAIWLRAHRAWHEAGIAVQDRPPIGRGQVLAAVAPPAEPELRAQFAEKLDFLDAELFERTLTLLEGLPELGVLLQTERELPHLIRAVHGEHGPMFRDADLAQWQQAEERLRRALTELAEAAQSSYQSRLFARDALAGLRLIDLCRQTFDVVVMNPPFGALASGTKERLSKAYPRSKNDLLAVMVERGLELLRPGGRLGAITSRTCFFLSSFQKWREGVVLGVAEPEVMADLGHGVMDDAMVEAAAYCLVKR